MSGANERCPLAVGGALRRLFRRNDPYENLDLAATLIETAMGLVGPFFKDRRRPQGLDRAIAAVNAGAARLRTMAGRGSGRARGHDDDDGDDDEGEDDDDDDDADDDADDADERGGWTAPGAPTKK